jgi:hypothetical protein
MQIIRCGKIQIPSSALSAVQIKEQEEFRGSLGVSLTVFPLSKKNGLEAV